MKLRKVVKKLRHFFDPAKLAALAPYKLAYVIAQHKKPFSDCKMLSLLSQLISTVKFSQTWPAVAAPLYVK